MVDGFSIWYYKKRNILGICPEIYKDDFKILKWDTEITIQSVNEKTDCDILLSDALVFYLEV